jgi:hypothetical protein
VRVSAEKLIEPATIITRHPVRDPHTHTPSRAAGAQILSASNENLLIKHDPNNALEAHGVAPDLPLGRVKVFGVRARREHDAVVNVRGNAPSGVGVDGGRFRCLE